MVLLPPFSPNLKSPGPKEGNLRAANSDGRHHCQWNVGLLPLQLRSQDPPADLLQHVPVRGRLLLQLYFHGTVHIRKGTANGGRVPDHRHGFIFTPLFLVKQIDGLSAQLSCSTTTIINNNDGKCAIKLFSNGAVVCLLWVGGILGGDGGRAGGRLDLSHTTRRRPTEDLRSDKLSHFFVKNKRKIAGTGVDLKRAEQDSPSRSDHKTPKISRREEDDQKGRNGD